MKKTISYNGFNIVLAPNTSASYAGSHVAYVMQGTRVCSRHFGNSKFCIDECKSDIDYFCI